MEVCKHKVMTKWVINRTTRMWRRDCTNCGYYETYSGL